MNKVMFIAADPNHSSFLYVKKEYTTFSGGDDKEGKFLRHEVGKGHNAVVVWYDGSPDPFISSLNSGQIYIRGHCEHGWPCLLAARFAEMIPVEEVVERLIRSGLKREFSGEIKCYNCHSGEAYDPSDPHQKEDSCRGTNRDAFAQLVADELYARGYKLCRIFGYIGSLDSFAKDGSQGTHKYVRVFSGGQQVEAGRASENRLEFRPRVKKKFFKSIIKKFFFK